MVFHAHPLPLSCASKSGSLVGTGVIASVMLCTGGSRVVFCINLLLSTVETQGQRSMAGLSLTVVPISKTISYHYHGTMLCRRLWHRYLHKRCLREANCLWAALQQPRQANFKLHDVLRLSSKDVMGLPHMQIAQSLLVTLMHI